jgi:hypothetical protein
MKAEVQRSVACNGVAATTQICIYESPDPDQLSRGIGDVLDQNRVGSCLEDLSVVSLVERLVGSLGRLRKERVLYLASQSSWCDLFKAGRNERGH